MVIFITISFQCNIIYNITQNGKKPEIIGILAVVFRYIHDIYKIGTD